MTFNQTLQDHQSLFESSPAAAALLTALIGVIIVCILVGNTLVILAVCLVQNLRNQIGSYLLVSLAAADFFVGALVMPLGLLYVLYGRWVFGAPMCKLWTTADVTLCTASILNLCVISVDRYLIITDPLKYAVSQRTAVKMLLYIAAVWVLALMISVWPLFAFPTRQERGHCQVSQNVYYQMYAMMLSFYIPTCIIIVVNFKIYRAAQRLRRQDMQTVTEVKYSQRDSNCVVSSRTDANDMQIKNGNVMHSDSELTENNTPNMNAANKRNSAGQRLLNQMSKRMRSAQRLVSIGNRTSTISSENKTLKTLGVIMSCYIICWLPFFLLALSNPMCHVLSSLITCPKLPEWLEQVVLWQGWLNSLLNPFIYAKFNRDFRVPFREMLRCRFSTLNAVCRGRQFVTQYGPDDDTAANIRPSRGDKDKEMRVKLNSFVPTAVVNHDVTDDPSLEREPVINNEHAESPDELQCFVTTNTYSL